MSVRWSDSEQVQELYDLLDLWAAPTPVQALQLLDRRFMDPKVCVQFLFLSSFFVVAALFSSFLFFLFCMFCTKFVERVPHWYDCNVPKSKFFSYIFVIFSRCGLFAMCMNIISLQVRAYAVHCLEDLPDDELALFMLQLCQQLKFERYRRCSLLVGLFLVCLSHSCAVLAFSSYSIFEQSIIVRNQFTFIEASVPVPSFSQCSLSFALTLCVLLSLIIKYSHVDSALSRFLLRRALAKPRLIGHIYYWLLQSEVYNVDVSKRYVILLQVGHVLPACLIILKRLVLLLYANLFDGRSFFSLITPLLSKSGHSCLSPV